MRFCNSTIFLNSHQGVEFSWMIKCCVYTTGATKSHFAWMPVKNGESTKPPFYPEDLHVTRWFPSGSKHVRVSTLPGTNLHLPWQYHIFTTTNSTSALLNRTTTILNDQSWMGNIRVFAVSKTTQARLVHCSHTEIVLIDVVVLLYALPCAL
jgi:hypothetical protein